MQHIVRTDLMWGQGIFPENPDFYAMVQAGGQSHGLFTEPSNVTSHLLAKGDSVLVMGADETSPTQVYYDGNWSGGGIYSNAADVSKNGTAIAKTPYENTSPRASMLLNGKWRDLDTVAPGLPVEWNFPAVSRFRDISEEGWVLLDGPTTAAAMLPIAVEGAWVVDPNTILSEGVGVDDLSIASKDSSFSPTGSDPIRERIWISAPVDGPSRNIILHAPLAPEAKLKISGTGALFGGLVEATRQFTGEVVDITAPGAASGAEIPVQLKIGTQDAINSPVWLYAMKARTLKIRLYRVTKLYGTNSQIEPMQVDAAALSQKLTNIFKPQINLTVEITMAPGTANGAYPVRWDLDGFLSLATTAGAHTVEQLEILGNNDILTDSNTFKDDYQMRMFVIGNVKEGGITTSKGNGHAPAGQKTCWIRGNDIATDLFEVVCAHEPGHHLFGPGHPDLGDGIIPYADLPPHVLRKMLMVSGNKLNPESRITTKAQWAEAEKWLVKEVDK